MEPKDFLTLANELAASEKAAEARSATSRAYYAAFHCALNILQDMGFDIPSNHRSHEAVSAHLTNSGNPTVDDHGRTLLDFRGWRNNADYEIEDVTHEDPKKARQFVKIAEYLIRELEDECEGPERDEIIASIKAYLEKLKS